MKRWVCAAFLVLGTACPTAIVVNPDVQGPHGEHLMELKCTSSERCMAFARENCGGDFDIISNNTEVGGGGNVGNASIPVTSADVMMVQCKTPPGAAPAAPDAGP